MGSAILLISVFTRAVASTVANDADLPSDRPALLDRDAAESRDAEAEGDSDREPTDELAAARSKHPVEVAVPF